jgi:CheY-like chemotaxis protein
MSTFAQPGIHRSLSRPIQPPPETATASRVILVVENDWRTRHFISTLLKYSTNALVIESSHPHEALVLARDLEPRLDLLISNVNLADAQTGLDLSRDIAASHPSASVLLVSNRNLPPHAIPPAWRFLSIPFTTASFLDCVGQLCCAKS